MHNRHIMEQIIDYLKRSITSAGPRRWAAIAEDVSKEWPPEKKLSFHSLRKIAYGERDNLGLKVGQALLDYFQAVDQGAIELPAESDEKQTTV